MLENILEVVAFTIGNNEFCIDIKHINAIILYDQVVFSDINSNCKDIHYNGKTIRLFDFNSLVDMSSDQINMETRIVVLEIDKKYLGFPVKKIVEFRSVNLEDYKAYTFDANGHYDMSDNSENSNGYVISKLKAAKIFLSQTA